MMFAALRVCGWNKTHPVGGMFGPLESSAGSG